jgi:hypothetical protein
MSRLGPLLPAGEPAGLISLGLTGRPGCCWLGAGMYSCGMLAADLLLGPQAGTGLAAIAAAAATGSGSGCGGFDRLRRRSSTVLRTVLLAAAGTVLSALGEGSGEKWGDIGALGSGLGEE